jgi:hypothetical protein
MSGFAKRFGFQRSNTSGEPSGPSAQTELSDYSKGGVEVGTNLVDGEQVIDNTVNKISQEEAAQRLKAFRREHHFDPNLPDEAFDAIDENLDAGDAKGEAQLVGEIIENSPYPEVSITAVYV